MRRTRIPLLVAAMASTSAHAHGQTMHYGALADVASGVEGGASRVALRRARTTLRFGADAFLDESPKDVFSVAGIVEVEPRAAVGLEVRYRRLFGERFSASAGLTSILAPSSIYGGTVDFVVTFPWSKSLNVTVGPTVNAFPLGADLPDGTILWQAFARVGLRANL
ncbi:MAG: hypothetical protein U0169_09790 [Polyangiaceae bacterium]